jgi:thiopeptide-type bacteriocin biosynthesis protein
MMNYDLHDRIFLRVPRFPVDDSTRPLDDMLQDHIFRDALYLASDVVYKELIRNDFQIDRCSEKMKHSLVKYQKRMCYRPTPFGAFAGIAILPIRGTIDQIVIAQQSFQTLLMDKDKQDTLANETLYCVNPLLYPYGGDFRVIGKGEKDKHSTFVISEIYGSDAVRALLSNHITLNLETLLHLLNDNGIVSNELDWFIGELIQLQILLPYQKAARHYPVLMSHEHKDRPGGAYDSYCRFVATGSLPKSTAEKMHDALYCLHKVSGHNVYDALNNFKVGFEKLFEKREVSLLQALDPELGIDYDSMSNAGQWGSNSKKTGNILWSSLQEMLLAKWTMQTDSANYEISILESDLEHLPLIEKNYPPGSSFVFTVAGDKLHVKAAGGASSLNMIGRFTVLDADTHELSRELAAKEMRRNPDVLFAEISHIDSPEVASVNKKTLVYDYQIPFFEAPEVREDFLIPPNDLYVSIVNNRLVLRSARLNKQIIPRFSNAYNYQRSTLPVFRFLCDMQHEGVDTNLNFSLARMFPGLPRYPRITYKDVILEAASWHVSAKDLLELKKLHKDEWLDGFAFFALQINLPQEFSYEVHDHLLHLNLSLPEDVSLLLKTIPSTGKIIFREYLKSQEALVKDDRGKSYTHECIAFMINKERSYTFEKTGTNSQNTLLIHNDKLLPFDEWLYFKIYLHPAGYRDLLIEYIYPFITENVRKGNISSWFFISYFDDDFHLRVRVKQTPGRDTQLLKTYKKLEKKLRHLPNLKKLELSTYFKERERYAYIGIQTAEKLFGLSSEIVLSELTKADGTDELPNHKLFSAIRHLWLVFHRLNFGISETEELARRFSGHLSRSERIDLDMEFREFRTAFRHFLVEHREPEALEFDYLDAMISATRDLSSDEKLQVIMDINHMHLNRHYMQDQQKHEIRGYYFLAKVLQGFGYLKV